MVGLAPNGVQLPMTPGAMETTPQLAINKPWCLLAATVLMLVLLVCCIPDHS